MVLLNKVLLKRLIKTRVIKENLITKIRQKIIKIICKKEVCNKIKVECNKIDKKIQTLTYMPIFLTKYKINLLSNKTLTHRLKVS